MTKEIYIALRDQQEFPLSLFWEYYKEKGGTYREKEFIEHFPKYMMGNIAIVGNDGHPKVFNYASNVTKIINYFNNKYSI